MSSPRPPGAGERIVKSPIPVEIPAKAAMETWSEPPVKALAPSFKEYPHLNIERHGVLQEMAPLGSLPSSNLKKKARQETIKHATASKNGIRASSSESLGYATDVQEITPRVEIEQRPSTPEAVLESRRRSESGESDYIPRTPHAQTILIKGSSHSVLKAQVEPWTSPSLSESSPRKMSSSTRLDKVVDEAVHQALSNNRLPTAYALRTLYDEYRALPNFSVLFEHVFYRTANDEQMSKFQNLMTFKKKEGRRGGTAVKFFKDLRGQTPTTTSLFSHTYSVASSSTRKPSTSGATADRASRSPHKDSSHVNKKHKGSDYTSPFPPLPVLNGSGIDHNSRELSQSNGDEPVWDAANGLISRVRTGSMSSSSSLSSLDEDMLRENLTSPSMSGSPSRRQKLSKDLRGHKPNGPGGALKSPQDPSHAKSKSHANGTTGDNYAPIPSNQNEPMTNDKTLGPKLHAFPTSTTTTNCITSSVLTSSASQQVANNNTSMAAYVEEPIHASSTTFYPSLYSSQQVNPSLFPPKTHQTTLKFPKKLPGSGVSKRLHEDDITVSLKRKAKEVTENGASVKESSVRKPRSRHQEITANSDGNQPVAVTATPVKSGQTLRLRPVQSSKKPNHDLEELSSPTLLSFHPELAPRSATNSRAGTPTTVGRPARKARAGGPRMKTSPMKNKSGPSAGIPRASGERNSPVGNGVPSNGQDDNDDYCSSCGASGDLVCCDGCTRSFHLNCVDPPMTDGGLPDSWFCNVCYSSRHPPKEHTGPFGALIMMNDRRNPRAFSLPKEVREYFDSVRTGTDGEYEDGPIPVATSKAKNRNGYEEPPDHLKLRDAKGNLVICWNCKEGPGTKRPIIACTYCSLTWHLDCLDPPLSNPPNATRQWRCPMHVDDLLSKIPAALGPAHRFRRIKGASAIVPAIARGTRNNGHIEVDLDSSDEEDDNGFFDRKEFGHVYKLPEEGIKLDFISKLRGISDYKRTTMFVARRPSVDSFNEARHSLAERQAALCMAQIATTIPNDDAQVLVDALMTEAPPTVIKLIAQGNATDLIGSGDNRRNSSKKMNKLNIQSLEAMKALIQRQIDGYSSEFDEVEIEEAQITSGQGGDEDTDMLL